jgi:NAD(P)H-nitrite reductase large subunit
VILDDGDELGFEKLLLATGGNPFVPQIAGLEKYDFFTFTTLDDSVRIREKLAREGVDAKAVVLGGGLIGLKAAEALTQRGVHVKVVELADRVLSPVLDEQASGLIQSVLEREGIEVLTGHTITEVVGEDSQVNGVILDNPETIDCDLLIIAIGVRPRVELAKDTPIQIGRGIIVDKHMKTSVPEIYACGDCAEVYDFIADSFRLTPLWPTAHVGGRVAGSNMAGIEKEYVWGTGMNAVDFFGFPVISAGLIDPPDGEEMEVLAKLDPGEKVYRKFLIREQRIAGMILVNQVDRAGLILHLMREKVDVTSFKADLLRGDFGAIYLPRDLRLSIAAA